MERETVDTIIKRHPEKKEIFELVRLIDKGCVPYWFNYDREIRPTPFNHDGEDAETYIDWNKYPFQIMIECPDTAHLSIMFNHSGDPALLELTDVNTKELITDLSAAKAHELIVSHFNK